jgi:hypothetical protein
MRHLPFVSIKPPRSHMESSGHLFDTQILPGIGGKSILHGHYWRTTEHTKLSRALNAPAHQSLPDIPTLLPHGRRLQFPQKLVESLANSSFFHTIYFHRASALALARQRSLVAARHHRAGVQPVGDLPVLPPAKCAALQLGFFPAPTSSGG